MKGPVVWKFEDNFNADLIVGSKNIAVNDKEILRNACLADFDPGFVARCRPGSLMVAGSNFGYGHPHQQGIISLKEVGVSTMIAESFYPMWYRVAVYYAFPAIVCKGVFAAVSLGDEIKADPKTGSVKNLTTGTELQGEPIPDFLLHVIELGGFPRYVKERLEAGSRKP